MRRVQRTVQPALRGLGMVQRIHGLLVEQKRQRGLAFSQLPGREQHDWALHGNGLERGDLARVSALVGRTLDSHDRGFERIAAVHRCGSSGGYYVCHYSSESCKHGSRQKGCWGQQTTPGLPNFNSGSCNVTAAECVERGRELTRDERALCQK